MSPSEILNADDVWKEVQILNSTSTVPVLGQQLTNRVEWLSSDVSESNAPSFVYLLKHEVGCPISQGYENGLIVKVERGARFVSKCVHRNVGEGRVWVPHLGGNFNEHFVLQQSTSLRCSIQWIGIFPSWVSTTVIVKEDIDPKIVDLGSRQVSLGAVSKKAYTMHQFLSCLFYVDESEVMRKFWPLDIDHVCIQQVWDNWCALFEVLPYNKGLLMLF